MKKIMSILLGVMALSSAANASQCRSTTLILHPAKGTEAVCQALQMSGPVQMVSCSATAIFFKTTSIEVALTPVGTGYVAKSTFVDTEDRSVSISQLTLNMKDRTFSNQEVTTDRRGHVRSNAVCAGTISF